MELIKTFNFNGKELMVYGTNDKPYFKAKEIALILNYEKPKEAIRANVDSEDVITWGIMKWASELAPYENMHPETKFINESGLYALIFGSKKPEAKKFKHWVTSILLPSIRKTGKYEIDRQYKTPLPMLTYNMETESDLHNKTVNFIRQHQESKRLLFNSSLGEMQDSPDKRINAWKKGYSAGMPDFVLFNSTKKYSGLIIEFKSPKCTGKLSDDQRRIIKHFKTLNYKTIVSNNYDKIIIEVNKYIEQIRIPCEYCKCKFHNKSTLKNHHKYFHRITI